MLSFLLITGMPGCGKTTMVKRLVNEVCKSRKLLKCKGFYTEEIRDSKNERIGFDIVSLDGKRGILSRVGSEITNSNRPSAGMSHRVGKYVVYVHEFESFAMPLVESVDAETLLVIDEIGKMELLSKVFENFIKSLLSSKSNVKILATIPLKSPVNLIDQIKNNQKSRTIHITKSNRDEIYFSALESVENLFSH